MRSRLRKITLRTLRAVRQPFSPATVVWLAGLVMLWYGLGLLSPALGWIVVGVLLTFEAMPIRSLL